MTILSSDWLESVCQHCGLSFRFKPAQLGESNNCPHCKQGVTLTEASPAQLAAAASKAKQQKKLPVWLKWMLAVCFGSLLLTFAMFGMVNWIPTLSMAALWQVYGWYMFAFILISLCGTGLWILFLIYVFVYLTEMRALLRQIAVNTRASRMLPSNTADKGQSAWPAPVTPLVPASPPAEDQKYMPK